MTHELSGDSPLLPGFEGLEDRERSPESLVPMLRTYGVQSKARQPLIDFMVGGLEASGCRIVHQTVADRAPFVFVVETPEKERLGFVAYAFRATRTPTKNRPEDERSFQVKYGSKSSDDGGNLHDLWFDPNGMFTTIFLGIDPEDGFCVSADPIVHSPTKFFIRIEFKDQHAEETRRAGLFAWERAKRRTPSDAPRVETLVGARRDRFLDLIRFERAAVGSDPGNRLILADRWAANARVALPPATPSHAIGDLEHPLLQQFAMTPSEVFDLIESSARLKMAVRGWVAEEHLHRYLCAVPGVSDCIRLEGEGQPDVRLRFRGAEPLTIECKNVSRDRYANGDPKIDFQRTRAAKGDPCSRYYSASDFDVVAACLHSVLDRWEFRFHDSRTLGPHQKCEGKLASNVRIDDSWAPSAEAVLSSIVRR